MNVTLKAPRRTIMLHPIAYRRFMKAVNAPWPETMTPQVARELRRSVVPRVTFRDLWVTAAVVAVMASPWAVVAGVVWLAVRFA